jgi:hypothetical protein
LGEGAVTAEMAVQARDVMVQRNAVADFEVAREDARPTTNTDDGSGGFMSEDAGRRDGAMEDFFDVGGADAAHGNLDEEFMGADAGYGDGFEAQVVDAAIDDGAHGFRDVRHGGILTQSRKDAKTQRRKGHCGMTKAHLDTAPKRSAAVLGCEFLGRPRPVDWAWLRDAAKTRRRRRLRYGSSVKLRPQFGHWVI